jgi:hypothetical protein
MLYLALRRAGPTTPHLTLPWDTTFKVTGGLVRTAFGRGRPSLRLHRHHWCSGKGGGSVALG